MTFNLSFIIGPLVGAIIGLITNGIAIRMLFRPLHPVKIGNWTLPFTPGIIPKEKARIAKSCGSAIGKYLINEEAMSDTLLSDQMDQKISDYCDYLVNHNQKNQETIREVIISSAGQDHYDQFLSKSQNSLTKKIYAKACNPKLGEELADIALNEAQNNSLFGAFSFLIRPEALKEKISETINGVISSKGENIINHVIVSESNNMLDTSFQDLYEKYHHHLPKVKESIIGIYHYLVKHGLSTAMQAINITQIVEDKINEFDVKQMEEILLEIMHKELNAIIWLGGLLGMIMGFIMNVI